MHVLLSIVIVIGFLFLVIVGALRVMADLLEISTHQQPSFPDEFPEEGRESLDLHRSGTSMSLTDT